MERGRSGDVEVKGWCGRSWAWAPRALGRHGRLGVTGARASRALGRGQVGPFALELGLGDT